MKATTTTITRHPETRTLIDTHTLALRWTVSPRTVLRYCRYGELSEIQFTPTGKLFFRVEDVAALELQLFCRNK